MRCVAQGACDCTSWFAYCFCDYDHQLLAKLRKPQRHQRKPRHVGEAFLFGTAAVANTLPSEKPGQDNKKTLTAHCNEGFREAYWARTNDLHRVRVAL